MLEQPDPAFNRKIVNVVVERNDVETLVRNSLPDITGLNVHTLLQAPFRNIAASDISDVWLQLQTKRRERRILVCGVLDVETGAAPDLKEPDRSGSRKESIDGLCLKCFQDSR